MKKGSLGSAALSNTEGQLMRLRNRMGGFMQAGARALFKVDVGDRAQEADVSIADMAGSHATIKGAEAGAFGVELGVGASLPVAESSALFMDASVDLRDGQQSYNASVGYRLSF